MKDLIEELEKDLLSIHDDLRDADDDIQFKIAGCLGLCFKLRAEVEKSQPNLHQMLEHFLDTTDNLSGEDEDKAYEVLSILKNYF